MRIYDLKIQIWESTKGKEEIEAGDFSFHFIDLKVFYILRLFDSER